MREKVINGFGIILFAGAFTWMGLQAYYGSQHEADDSYYSQLPSIMDTIAPNKVCMADDVYQGNYPTIATSIAAKTYFACDQKGIQELFLQGRKRIAIDPFSNRNVDKAKAVISIDPKKDGKVMYFESEVTHRAFVRSLAENRK